MYFDGAEPSVSMLEGIFPQGQSRADGKKRSRDGGGLSVEGFFAGSARSCSLEADEVGVGSFGQFWCGANRNQESWVELVQTWQTWQTWAVLGRPGQT